jgi:hypothetical protein
VSLLEIALSDLSLVCLVSWWNKEAFLPVGAAGIEQSQA